MGRARPAPPHRAAPAGRPTGTDAAAPSIEPSVGCDDEPRSERGRAACAPMTSAWDAFVEASETAFPLQLSAWAAAKAATGWRAVRVVADGWLGTDRRPAAHPSPRAGAVRPRLPASRPRGPHASTDASVAAFTARSARSPARERLTHVTADPGLEGSGHHSLLTAAGWRPSDAAPAHDDAAHRPRRSPRPSSGRTSTSRAVATRTGRASAGCTVREGDEAALPVFYDILVETAQRSGFIPRGLEAYRDVYRAFAATAAPTCSSATCRTAEPSRAR